MKSIKLFLVVAGLTLGINAFAQNQDAMRISEVLVDNKSDLVDNFGEKGSWIELFNSSYGTVDLAGCYITDDPTNLKKYVIPSGDNATQIKPRQFVVFYCDATPHKGTFHTSFNLADSTSNEIILVKGDGKTIIDRVAVRHDLAEGVSYGRKDNEKATLATTDGLNENWVELEFTTPGVSNAIIDGETKSQKMYKVDPYGWILALTAMSVVFCALAILFLLFKGIGKLNTRAAGKPEADKEVAPAAKAPKAGAKVSDETYAAIAMALHLWNQENEAHDEESFVITFNRDHANTPWSSKIHSMLQTPLINKK